LPGPSASNAANTAIAARTPSCRPTRITPPGSDLPARRLAIYLAVIVAVKRCRLLLTRLFLHY